MQYESTITTTDIGCQVVTVETIRHNGTLVFSCGDVRRKYIGYTLDDARGLFRDLLRDKNLI